MSPGVLSRMISSSLSLLAGEFPTESQQRVLLVTRTTGSNGRNRQARLRCGQHALARRSHALLRRKYSLSGGQHGGWAMRGQWDLGTHFNRNLLTNRLGIINRLALANLAGYRNRHTLSGGDGNLLANGVRNLSCALN